MPITDPDWESFRFTTAEGGIVDAEELRAAARQLDPDCFRQEFEAEFAGLGANRVYYAFDRAVHLEPVTFHNLYPLAWSLDFNVNPMCMLIIQRVGDIVYVLDEIILRDSNTPKACVAFFDRLTHLLNKVPAHQRPLHLEIYGDASGNQRRTSGTDTDWAIIRHFLAQYKGQVNPSIHANTSNPLVRDRVNCVNARLNNALSESHLFIDPRCTELIRDLEQVIWALDSTGLPSNQLDKSDPARTHSSDALGYFVAQAFPLRPLAGHQSVGRLL
jgi:hypothetical protein